MPILNDILDHDVIGCEYRRGLEEGIEKGVEQGLRQGVVQGVQEGMERGLQQGEVTVLRRLIEKRFGSVPGWAEQRLIALPTRERENLSERILDAGTIEELFS